MVFSGCSGGDTTSGGQTGRTYSQAEYDAVVNELEEVKDELDALKQGGTSSDVAAAPASDFTYEYNAELGGVVIHKYNESGTLTVRVPDEREGEPVVAIDKVDDDFVSGEHGGGAFADCGIKKIILPDTVKQIGTQAFRNCAVTDINMPSALEALGNCAFDGCVGLTSLTIQGKITIYITGSTVSVFDNCNSNLEVIYDGVPYKAVLLENPSRYGIESEFYKAVDIQ
jgi:hypothetical protein